MTKKYRSSFLAILLLIGILVTSCAGAADDNAGETPPAGDGDAAAGQGTFLERAMNKEFAGTAVKMFGPFTDEDAVKFDAAIKPFEEQTGIDIQYEGSKEFEATIAIRVNGGNAPDIADFPQPGLLANFVKDGKVLDAGTFLDMDKLKQNYNQSWLDMAMMDGPNGDIMAGVWHRVNAKSLVWYPKKEFEEAGYKIPQTWDELIALSNQIVEDGGTPWCIGIESGAATGWPATDWLEEIMLRTTSLENYDKWTTGELPFTDESVKNAVKKMSEIWLNNDYVYGGRKAIVTTFFGDSPKPMFDNPPGCYMHKQGNFITSFFPPGLAAGEDYSFFYLPPIDEQFGKPVLVAGDLMAAFNDRPEVRAVMEFFTTGESVSGWVASGGAISPHKDLPLDAYTNEVDRGIAEIILNADSARFDGSDLMPGAVGAGTFWKGMTDYISGTVDLDEAMTEIQAGWTTVK
ncbi:ABC transporter substrate-binding protein [Paenibacillus alkalitolerans]|uniref:ABC transporter substrate-binding protein n=1 Tax=Paenibacillus alkalitolerans TaxID=2799335 RepID=UPI0018F5C9A2|nr:ABC transporter substrate-binding protein [Paenibacillus alkalitolerans]